MWNDPTEKVEFLASKLLAATTVYRGLILKKAFDWSFNFLSNAAFDSVLGPLVRKLSPKAPDNVLARFLNFQKVGFRHIEWLGDFPENSVSTISLLDLTLFSHKMSECENERAQVWVETLRNAVYLLLMLYTLKTLFKTYFWKVSVLVSSSKKDSHLNLCLRPVKNKCLKTL